ncbi:TonB-dependent receptor [Snuella lapsa]
MKTIANSLLFFLFFAPASLLGQTMLSGMVTEQSTSLPLPGVNVLVKGTTTGTATDFDGKYTIEVNAGDVLLFSFIGYQSQEVIYSGQTELNIVMAEDAAQLSEVVVIGYGSTSKKDATGAVELLKAEDLNKGAIVSADQMINGKSTGVRIVNSGGQPDANPNIRIRGGSSLSGNNSPLIVIDGIPLSNISPAGQANPLTLVNPNDIESFSILKDASSTAIYGSRASNGVIIITTKSGSKGAPKFNLSSSVQVGTLPDKIDVFNSGTYSDFINALYPDSSGLLGVNGTIYNTDWQEEIYRTSMSVDNNFSARANLFEKVPFRASFGHSGITGILKESQLNRYTASLNIAPEFLDNHLKVTINAKGIATEKDQPDEGAIGSALELNPTQPVFDPNGGKFNGYYQLTDADGNVGPTNALAKLKQRERNEDADRILGNLELNYKFHWLPELRAIVNMGLDYSESDINEFYLQKAIDAYTVYEGLEIFNNFSPNYEETQLKRDHTLDGYLSYTKNLEGFVTKVDAQAGYSYQNFYSEGIKFPTNTDNGFRQPSEVIRYANELNLQSFFGRLNLDLKDRYLLTASLRADGSSLFSEDKRWGYFPAFAFAWKLDEEGFLSDSNWVDTLKMRIGWGLTGQQDITGTAGYYPYTALYVDGDPTVSYIFGNQAYTTYRANVYNPDLTWEKTKTLNVGVDFELFENILSGNVDYYIRETKDLLAEVPQPEGALKNRFVSNVGNTESEGVELALQLKPITTDDFSLEINGNLAFNETYVTDLENIEQYSSGGGIGRGTGVNILQTAVGQRGRAFWLYEQVYNSNGDPIADAFVDKNGDGVISDSDRVFTPVDPKWTYGFGTSIFYKNLDFSANFRGQLGGHIYDANLLNKGYSDVAIPTNDTGYIKNALNLFDGTTYNGFQEKQSDLQALSDFYLSDATFLRLDNITLGYKLENFISKNLSLRLYASVNNVFVITDYKGLDPENFDGIEQSPYARPRTYTFGVNLDF